MDMFCILLSGLVVIAVAVVVTRLWLHNVQVTQRKYPPGPMCFPIVGSLPQVLLQSHLTPSSAPAMLSKLSEHWGDVMSLRVGVLEAVIFSSHEAAQKILNHEKAEDRVADGAIQDRLMHKNLGINFSNGITWKTLRKFTIRTLRDFGFGKSSLDPIINDEVDKLISHWKDKEEITVLFESMFDMTILNVMWRLLTGERFLLDDPKMTQLLYLIHGFNKSTNLCVDLTVAFPFIRKWIPSSFTGKLEQLKCCKAFQTFCRDTLHNHRKTGAYINCTNNFVDKFANQIHKRSGDGDEIKIDPHFNDDQFVVTIIDLLENGVDTISSTLTFAVLYGIVHPNAQELVQKEIDSVLAESGCEYISWDMLNRFPYTKAYILETLRFSSLLPVVAPRQATDDFYFGKFLIKKGTSLIVNLQALNNSKLVWIDPENFRPERFLDNAGVLDAEKAQLVMAFGSGRRVCPAQGFAEQVLFIYFTTLMNRYKFIPADNMPFPVISPKSGMTNIPNSFYAKIINRKGPQP